MVRKGQIAGQVFIYIMALIVIGVIIIIGYKAIGTFSSKTCTAERINFNSNIINLIEKYNSYGSVNIKSVKAPCDYDTICFVDSRRINFDNNNADFNFLCPENPIIKNSATTGARQNIFAVSNDRTISIGYSDLITLADATVLCTCINQTGGNFKIKFSGKGSSTEISGG
ncbi:MAG: hypothetical protein ACP5OA_05700 [Candidatus Woesearchaeota archaeon]